MKILGIDPGSLVTGYGVVESTGGRGKGGPAGWAGAGGGKMAGAAAGRSGLVHVSDGVVTLKGLKDLPARLLALAEGLDAVLRDFSPDAVAVESVFHSKNARSALMLGHSRGVVLLAAARYGLPVYEYPPTTVKQAVTGYGLAAKDQVNKMVGILLGRPPSAPALPADAADALAVAICHINHSARTAPAGARTAPTPRSGAL
ncbi:MAG: crossover junction endodeoxyribonuclease RuvC [Thermodesulfobacteriota bacterium]